MQRLASSVQESQSTTSHTLWCHRRPQKVQHRRLVVPCSAVLDRLRRVISRSGLDNRGAVDDLLTAVESTQRGLSTSKTSRAQIDASVNFLEKCGKGDVTTDSSRIDATWRLLWTTEKVDNALRLQRAKTALCIHFMLLMLQETLWIVKNAKLFGTEAGNVYQAR